MSMDLCNIYSDLIPNDFFFFILIQVDRVSSFPHYKKSLFFTREKDDKKFFSVLAKIKMCEWKISFVETMIEVFRRERWPFWVVRPRKRFFVSQCKQNFPNSLHEAFRLIFVQHLCMNMIKFCQLFGGQTGKRTKAHVTTLHDKFLMNFIFIIISLYQFMHLIQN